MLKTLLGAAGFRKGMDLYFSRHDGHAATVEQFVQCFVDANGKDLSQFMRWYSQAGTPEVTVTATFDAKSKTYSLAIAQVILPTPGQPTKDPMVIPLGIGLLGADGRDLPLVCDDGQRIEGLITLEKAVESYRFKNVAARPVLSINRGFSAPVKLTANLSAEDLRFLAAHDADPFNRWQALQSLATALLIDNVSALRSGTPPRNDDGLLAALAAILKDEALEPAFVAQALAMPSEADIARDLGKEVDPDAIFAARRALRVAISKGLRRLLADTYERMSDQTPYRPDAAGAGRRSLRNICLDLLAAPGDRTEIERGVRQYHAANNMTDQFAALTTLSQHDVPQRQDALDDFHRRFSSDALVIDKWLALQSLIPEPATLDRVRRLTKHAAFSFANPNRVRALIGTFAHGNQTQFNRRDGAGFMFVAETVLELDGRNPQVAARLMTAFRAWRALEATRRGRAEAALRHVAAAGSLSNDVKDIVERSLAER
jgi:aminopeptidase N